MNEIWKPVVGFESSYEVSNCGAIRSARRKIAIADSTGRSYSKMVGGIVRKAVEDPRSGHLNIALWAGNKQTMRKVHHLVLEAFVGPCPDGMECAHGDGRPANNAVSNLRWDTHVSNCADRIEHGTEIRGERNHRAKLTEADVLRIRTMTQQEAVTTFGIHQSTASLIHSGKTWRHV